mmetsp:Transcript_78807/g.225784  ORF Transcript_78807/g.225784 Transcript_78807/m.225784 type:complete len:415 (-) Transcript_78807:103-1347(-)
MCYGTRELLGGGAALHAHIRRHEGVIQQAAGAADPDLARSTIASNTILRLVVRSAPCVLVVVPEEPHVAELAPVTPPRVLDQPILIASIILAVFFDEHGMPKDGILLAIVEDAGVVVLPGVGIHGHDDRARLHQRLHQRLRAVAGQLVPAADADAGGRLPEASRLMARAGLLCVPEILVERDAVVSHPGEGELARGAIAAAGASAVLGVRHAVQERLHRDRDVRLLPAAGALLADELRLDGLCGGDGPAAAAVALVPDRGAGPDVHAAGGTGRRLVGRGVDEERPLGQALHEGHAVAAGHAAAGGLVAVQDLALGISPVHEGMHARRPEAALPRVPGVRGCDLNEGGFEERAAVVELLRAYCEPPAEVPHILLEGIALQLRPSSAPVQGRRISTLATQEDCTNDGCGRAAIHGT